MRGMFFRQSNDGFDTEVADGFNLIDSVSSEVAALPSGVRGLTWVGDYDKTLCTWEVSDAQISSYVTAHKGDPKVGVVHRGRAVDRRHAAVPQRPAAGEGAQRPDPLDRSRGEDAHGRRLQLGSSDTRSDAGLEGRDRHRRAQPLHVLAELGLP